MASSVAVKPGRRVVSRGELRATLLEHAENPSKLTYRELPLTVGRDFWLSLDEEHRGWYAGDADSLMLDPPVMGATRDGERTGRYLSFSLTPGSYDAWVIE